MNGQFNPPLDEGIARYVEVLNAEGIETFESCQGGAGHAVDRPMVRFAGNQAQGIEALGIALRHRFPVAELRRSWPILDGEPTGPHWELVFVPTSPALRG